MWRADQLGIWGGGGARSKKYVSKWTHGFFITINGMILYFKHIIHIDDFLLNGHPPSRLLYSILTSYVMPLYTTIFMLPPKQSPHRHDGIVTSLVNYNISVRPLTKYDLDLPPLLVHRRRKYMRTFADQRLYARCKYKPAKRTPCHIGPTQ